MGYWVCGGCLAPLKGEFEVMTLGTMGAKCEVCGKLGRSGSGRDEVSFVSKAVLERARNEAKQAGKG